MIFNLSLASSLLDQQVFENPPLVKNTSSSKENQYRGSCLDPAISFSFSSPDVFSKLLHPISFIKRPLLPVQSNLKSAEFIFKLAQRNDIELRKSSFPSPFHLIVSE
ncbi:hypothetical protein CDAR_529871 [Caerostris darwini]|uniref:Uncharacterized protein n=1 Tax=Caerostris darwini TaxID=1538125 RepID=A0AAV4SCK8_9ARAC|nr:hypothetical protein CDAR_529871 [Caerostris darwini]